MIRKRDRIERTIKHNRALVKLAKENNCMRFRFYFHDLDKIPLCFFMSDEKLTRRHISKRKHHNPIKEIDFLESVLDWESCRFTKEDCPLTAREYLRTRRGFLDKIEYDTYLRIIDELGF